MTRYSAVLHSRHGWIDAPEGWWIQESPSRKSYLSDEDGFVLQIFPDDGPRIDINIQSIVFDFYKNVQAEIRPYVLEAESARASIPAGYAELDDGYELDDPKSPGYHDRMVD